MSWRRLKGKSDCESAILFLEFHKQLCLGIYKNIKTVGIDSFSGKLGEAEYFGYLDSDGRLKGILAHCWNDVVLYHLSSFDCKNLQSFDVKMLTRPISMVIGHGQLDGLINEDYFSRKESVFALYLERLQSNHLDLSNCHFADLENLEALAVLRAEFESEALGRQADLDKARAFVLSSIKEGTMAFYKGENDKPLAICSAVNQIDEIIQIGGVYVHPGARGHGISQLVVAAILLNARKAGLREAVLFTQNPPAVKVYTRLGFQTIGELMLAFPLKR